MNNKVEKFFRLYDSDPALRERIAQAEEAYPGSLEIREALVEAVLLPVAEELGLGFSVADLRAYETKLKMDRFRAAEAGLENDGPEAPQVYWLLDRGWSTDKSKFTGSQD